MKKLVAMSMIACMALVTAAACGSIQSSSDYCSMLRPRETTETADAAEETADAADTTASDKTWVDRNGYCIQTVRVSPMRTDEFVGIDVDIIKAVAEDQGFKY